MCVFSHLYASPMFFWETINQEPIGKGDFNLIVSNFEHERINADYYCLLFTVPKFDEFDPKM